MLKIAKFFNFVANFQADAIPKSDTLEKFFPSTEVEEMRKIVLDYTSNLMVILNYCLSSGRQINRRYATSVRVQRRQKPFHEIL